MVLSRSVTEWVRAINSPFKFQIVLVLKAPAAACDRQAVDMEINGGKKYLVTIIGPTAEFHETCLHIKRKVADVDFTRRLENGRRCPSYFSTTVKHRFRHGCHDVVAISAEKEKKTKIHTCCHGNHFDILQQYFIINWNVNFFGLELKLTCCTVRCLEAKCVRTGRRARWRRHTPSDPTGICDLPIPVPKTNISKYPPRHKHPLLMTWIPNKDTYGRNERSKAHVFLFLPQGPHLITLLLFACIFK